MDRDQINDLTFDAYLERAKALAGEDRFDEALEQLAEARKLSTADEEAQGLIDITEIEVEGQRRQRIHALESELKHLLNRDAGPLTEDGIRQGEETLALLQSIHPAPTELEGLTGRWRTETTGLVFQAKLEQTRQELNRLWDTPTVILSNYDWAIKLAEQLKADYPNETAAQELLMKAQEKREWAYNEQVELTTQAAEGNFKPLLDYLEKETAAGAAELPEYEWGIENGKRVLMSKAFVRPQAAIDHLKALAGRYQADKARSYIQEAEANLPGYPEVANEHIEKGLKFSYISDEVRQELLQCQQEKVEPALERRKKAQELVADAVAKEKNPEIETIYQVWGLLDAAAAKDPYTPEIETVRDLFRPRLKVALQIKLAQAGDSLAEGNFEDGAKRAQEVQRDAAAAEKLPDLVAEAERLAALCRADQTLFAELEGAAADIQDLAKTDLPQTVKKLTEWEIRIAGKPERFTQRLHSARLIVQDRQSLQELLQQWTDLYQETDPAQIEETHEAQRRASQELDRLDGEIKQAISRHGKLAELAACQIRVRARRNYFAGELAWTQGRYARSQELWQKVANAGSDDAGRARERLDQARDATTVSQALEEAQAFLDRKPANFGQARQVLAPWQTKASPRQAEVQQLYRQVEAAWVTQLQAGIDEIIANLERRPVYKQLVDMVEQLAKLAPDQAKAYKEQHFAVIYEEWGDKSSDWTTAEQHYQTALEFAAADSRGRLEGKHRQARRNLRRVKVDDFLTQGQPAAAQQELLAWMSEARQDAPGLIWLAELYLAEEAVERAQKMCLDLADRWLKEAARLRRPAAAGLSHLWEVEEWQQKLEALRYKVAEMTAIGQVKQHLQRWLTPGSSLLEYDMAQKEKDRLRQELSDSRQKCQQQQQERLQELEDRLDQAALQGVHQQVAQTVEDEWQKIRRWLDEQVSRNAGIQGWFNALELDLLGQLRQRWAATPSPDLNRLDFCRVSPEPALLERWEVGLKIRFLFKLAQEGDLTAREMSQVQGLLKQAVTDFIGDVKGPDYDQPVQKLNAGSPTPLQPLETQQRIGERLKDWLEGLRRPWLDYVRAMDRSQLEADVLSENVQELNGLSRNLNEFQGALNKLRQAAEQSYRRLERARSTGAQGWRSWADVPWATIVEHLLRLDRMPLPTLDRREMTRDYWQRLNDNDPELRWQAWQEAARILRHLRLADQPEMAPWETVINPIIIKYGPDEKWEEVEQPLKPHEVSFGAHRVVFWLKNEREEAQKKRNELVIRVVTLYTLIQAEHFDAVLEQLGHVETLDAVNEYGFRNGVLFKKLDNPDLNNLTWEEIKQALEQHKTQWEAFRKWWDQVEGSAWSVWQTKYRDEVIHLTRQSHFDAALNICRDALDGSQSQGRTNQLGGGMALKPLQIYLQRPPAILQSTLSYRLQHEWKKVEALRHDLQESLNELNFWVHGEESTPHSDPIPRSILSIAQDFKEKKETLDAVCDALKYDYRMPWQKRAKENQRTYCLTLLMELSRLAPEWPERQKYEMDIGEA